ncbi:MAG: hypothetical protein Kow0090_00880 [Myxococcota bacterium]
MGSIKIKRLAENDLNTVITLWKEAGLKIKPFGRDGMERLVKEIGFKSTFFLGAFDGERLVGVALANHEGRKGWINRLAVLPKYRRSGVGRLLVSAAEEAFRAEGISIFCALVEEWNEESLSFFTKSGYTLHRDIFYLSKRDREEE